MRVLILCYALLFAGLSAAAWAASGGQPRPELVVQNGHSLGISSLAFEAAGRRLATGSADGTAKIWEVLNDKGAATGRVRLTIKAHGRGVNGEGVTSVAWSPDGRTLATGGWDQAARLWDAATGQPSLTLPTDSEYHQTIVAWSPDGRTLATGNAKAVKLWELPAGRLRQALEVPEAVTALAWSPDGQTLAAGFAGGAQLRNAATGSLRREVRVSTANGEPAVAWSPDGRVLATGQNQIELWDTSTGERLQALPSGSEGGCTDLVFSADGRTLWSVHRSDEVRLWDLAGGTLKARATFQDSDRIRYGRDTKPSLALTPDGRSLATSHLRSNAISLWDPASLQPRAALEGRSSWVSSVVFSGSGNLMATGSGDGTVRVWDLAAGKLRTSLEGHAGAVHAVALSQDGDLLASGGRDGTVRVWDLEKRQTHLTLPVNAWVTGVALSQDARLLAAGDDSGMVYLWEVHSGKLLARRQEHGTAVVSVAFAPDGRMLATASLDGTVKQWDAVYRRTIYTRQIQGRQRYAGIRPSARAVAFTPDGRLLAAAGSGGAVNVWETLEEEKPPLLVPQQKGGVAYEPMESLAVSPDGRTLATGLDDGSVKIWDLASGSNLATLSGHTLPVTSLAFTPDGRVLATGSDDATVRFWEIASGKLLATAVELDRGREWVVTTPDGLFDGSPGGQKLMEWRIGDRLLALDQFYNDFYTPGLLALLLQRQPERPRVRQEITQLKPPPRVVIVSPRDQERVVDRSLTVRVSLESQGGGASRPALFLNGHRLPESRTRTGDSGAAFQVDLVEGRNFLRSTAYNADGTVESRADEITVLCASPPRKPKLHLLAVGVDHYRAGMELRFARRDAEAVASFFRAGLFSEVRTRTLLDEQATRQAILEALKGLQEADPRDAVLVYLAGHGTLVGDLFYYLPWDAKVGSDDDLRATGLSQVELGEALTTIPATKQILILDACHSGASAGSLGRLLARRDALGLIRAQQRLARSSGSFLIAASTAEQYAVEVAELGHGVLTYAILHALGEKGRPAAALNADGQVTVISLLRHLSDEVPALTKKYHGGRQDIVQASTGQDFPLVAPAP